MNLFFYISFFNFFFITFYDCLTNAEWNIQNIHVNFLSNYAGDNSCVNVLIGNATVDLKNPTTFQQLILIEIPKNVEPLAEFLKKNIRCAFAYILETNQYINDYLIKIPMLMRKLRNYQTIVLGGKRLTDKILQRMDTPIHWIQQLNEVNDTISVTDYSS